ncbi:UPF0280 family protein [Alisedimentitalea sp. MJ-SS2]|uniref:UPF0280 family protein n=1 Tax=Aliisedimentitalea sp. MJ-SS2 TaxID=3049795 RepID=UPI00290A6C96|nr:UPF0280 family protein [Alisedimentitalea sp. MJ-SS2]MDU8929878.1 UPF0280 family protein [Alisedimentitalea sp. MJ-SS2]
MSYSAAILPGERLHLQHGPIDLVIGVDGAREAGFGAACSAFDGVLEGLVDELERLRSSGWRDETPPCAVRGPVAKRMVRAVAAHEGFVTPMAAVAGAVADHVLAAIRDVSGVRRAYVNNGGDIALWLNPGERFRLAVAGPDGAGLGRVWITAGDGIGGVATSGRNGRSLSMGIADSVTVLAANAASADVAATLIGNAVNLPGHAAIMRVPALELRPDSDLGERKVVSEVGALARSDVARALRRGVDVAEKMRQRGLIHAAALFLRGQNRVVGQEPGVIGIAEREQLDA